VVLVIAGLAVVVAAVIGFWPVSVTVMGDSSYSCGSGFLHSRHTWKVDTKALVAHARPGIDTSFSATPLSACPSKLYEQRDFAYLLVVFALVGGLCGVVLLQTESSARDAANKRAVRRGTGQFDITRRVTRLPSRKFPELPAPTFPSHRKPRPT
jgi:hypothetical protein